MDTEEVKNGHKFPISMNMKNGLEFRETQILGIRIIEIIKSFDIHYL